MGETTQLSERTKSSAGCAPHNPSGPCRSHHQLLALEWTAIQSKSWVVVLVLSLLSMMYSIRNECELDSISSSFVLESKSIPSSKSEEVLHPVDWNWCPVAECHPSPVCHPCQRRFLMVITNGRSASTTLTWMLDLLPGLRMGGENNNAIQNIMTMIQETTKHPFNLDSGPKAKVGAWDHNPVPEGSLACPAQQMIEAIVPPTLWNETHIDPRATNDIIGFKTIRLVRDKTMADLPEIVQFLEQHFPCTRFLINYRSDFRKQAKSQVSSLTFYRKESSNMTRAVDRIAHEVGLLKKIARLLGRERAMLIDSAKWTKDVRGLNKAVEWLGFDKTCAFPALLELNRRSSSRLGKSQTADVGQKRSVQATQMNGRPGGGKSYQHGTTTLELDPRCRYVGTRH